MADPDRSKEYVPSEEQYHGDRQDDSEPPAPPDDAPPSE